MTRTERINSILQNQFQPEYLDVINESPLHHVGEAVETHFKVVMVSTQFESQPLIKRHRMVQGSIKQEFDSGLHALTLHLFTPEEWQTASKNFSSPACRGGFHAG